MTISTPQLTDADRAIIRLIILEILELDTEELTDTASFIEEYGADSLMAIEILARIEKDLDVTIEQDRLTEMTDLSAVFAIVAESRTDGAVND